MTHFLPLFLHIKRVDYNSYIGTAVVYTTTIKRDTAIRNPINRSLLTGHRSPWPRHNRPTLVLSHVHTHVNGDHNVIILFSPVLKRVNVFFKKIFSVFVFLPPND